LAAAALPTTISASAFGLAAAETAAAADFETEVGTAEETAATGFGRGADGAEAGAGAATSRVPSPP
jgi:hypothetical protein